MGLQWVQALQCCFVHNPKPYDIQEDLAIVVQLPVLRIPSILHIYIAVKPNSVAHPQRVV